MARVIPYFFATYLFLSAVCLPGGNIALLGEMPKMYAHCKAHEDKDMTILDFVTDHLICLDAMLDDHQGNDDQKPHQGIAIDFHGQPIFFQTWRPFLPAKSIRILNIGFLHFVQNHYLHLCLNDDLRPPIV